MKYLLGTHAFLWFISNDKRLSKNANALIRDRSNELYFSSASAWEISIKVGLGRLSIQDEMESFLLDQLSENGILPLPITIPHAAYISKLPGIHKDPFDRILIAQSVIEEMPLLSRDRTVKKYDVNVIW